MKQASKNNIPLSANSPQGRYIDSDVIVQVEDLGQQMSDFSSWLFRHISLRLQAGQATGITGPSGCGKSLLLRSIATLVPTSEGQILWKGTEVAVAQAAEFRADVIYVPQKASVVPGTFEDNLRLPFSFSVHEAKTYSRDTVLGVVHRLGRDESLLDQNAARLSGGELQVLSIIRAVQLNPSVLLLDEETSSVDAAMSDLIDGFLNDWASSSESPRSLIRVGHEVERLVRNSNEVFRLTRGAESLEPIGRG